MGKGQTECDVFVLSSTETIVTLKASLRLKLLLQSLNFSAGSTCIGFSYLYKFYCSWHATCYSTDLAAMQHGQDCPALIHTLNFDELETMHAN